MSGLVIAVTGTSAFFGRDLLVALQGDPAVERVIALDSKAPVFEGTKVVWEKTDLLQPRSGERMADVFREQTVDVVIHTAFMARPVHRGGWAHELEAIGTRHVLAAVEATNVRKLLLRSSTLVYGADALHPNYIRETAPLNGGERSRFIADKVEVEMQTARFAQKQPNRIVTLLRFAPLLGPTADTLATMYLTRPVCPTLMGFDPLVQLLHEEDAIGSVLACVHQDIRGAINIGAPSVLRLSQAVVLAGKRALPLPSILLRPMSEALWSVQVGHFPPGLVDFLKYLCVADLRRMQTELTYKPRYDVRQAVLSFASSQRLLRLTA